MKFPSLPWTLAMATLLWSATANAQQTELIRIPAPQFPGTNEFFGSAVSLSGEWLFVGDYAAQEPPPTSFAGAVYAYRRLGPSWQLTQRLTGEPSSRYGSIVIVDGTTLAVSAWSWDATSDNSDNTGKVYLYERQGGSWVPTQELLPAGIACNHSLFGVQMALSGDVLAVRLVDCPPPGAQVRIYERQGGIWNHVETFRSPSSSIGSIGASLAIDGNLIVAGVSDIYGSAVVFRRGPPGWYRSALLEDPDTEWGDRLGLSAAIEGDTIVLGAPARTEGFSGYASGHVVVYERLGLDLWTKVQRLEPSDPVTGGVDFGGQFGDSVAIQGGEIVVGSRHARTAGFDTGAVYYFEKGPAGWPRFETQRFVSHHPGRGDSVGRTLSLDSGIIVSSDLGAHDAEVLIMRRRLGSAFCDATPNSTGKEAALSIHGSELASEAETDFFVGDLPPGSSGGLAMSLVRTSERPVFNGNLCLGPAIRLVGPVAQADPEGRVEGEIDTARIGGAWVAGTTLHFQYWHDDVIGQGLDFSNAVELILR